MGLGVENATTEEGVDKFTALLWPSGNDFFCKTALEYSKFVAELDQVVMKMVSKCYGIENLRLMKYRVPTKDETSLGIVPHTDKSFMSILHQRQVKGLQVKTKTGRWIDVDPSPSSFIIMAGDACMGRVRATNHRVMMNGDDTRYSVALFSVPKPGYIIKAPAEMVDKDHPLLFRPFETYQFLDFLYCDPGRITS